MWFMWGVCCSCRGVCVVQECVVHVGVYAPVSMLLWSLCALCAHVSVLCAYVHSPQSSVSVSPALIYEPAASAVS